MRLFSSVFSPLRLIGVVALCYVFTVVEVAAVVAQIRTIGVSSVAMAAAAFAALALIRCWRWHVLVQSAGKDVPLRDAFAACNTSIWLGMATPARLGEFQRGLDLARRARCNLAEASALVVFELLLDLGAYAVLAVAGLLMIRLGGATAAGTAAWLAILVIGFTAVVFLRVPIALSIRVMPWLGNVPGLAALRAGLLAHLDGRRAVSIALCTVAALLAYAWMMTALIAPMRLSLGLREVATLIGLAGVAGAIPVTYFGLGTREVALIGYLGQLGIGKETAVAVSLLFLLAQLVGIAVSLALSLLLRPSPMDAGDAGVR